jgi:alkylation response protein AidB-like acyl-CoA dehydrogenase
METDARGCTILNMDLARQLGLEDCGLGNDRDRLLLRLMMPVAKMFTAKKAVANISEGLECFGGQVSSSFF